MSDDLALDVFPETDGPITPGVLVCDAIAFVMARKYAETTLGHESLPAVVPSLAVLTEAVFTDPSVLDVLEVPDLAPPEPTRWSAYLESIDEDVFGSLVAGDLLELRSMLYGRLLFRLARIGGRDHLAEVHRWILPTLRTVTLPQMPAGRGGLLFQLIHLLDAPLEDGAAPVH